MWPDQKNLTQKVRKLMEEAGELAKAALPYDHAFATNHRFVTRENPRGVGRPHPGCPGHLHTMGFDDEGIASMLKRKSGFWAELQAREARVHDKTP